MNARLMTAGGRVCVSTHREVSDVTVISDMRKMNKTSVLVSQDFRMFLVMFKCHFLVKRENGLHFEKGLHRVMDLCWTE